MTIKLFDTVEAVCDLPKANIKTGMLGAVIEIFDKPNLAYEVEFCNKKGQTVAQAALLPEQIIKANITKEEYNNRIPD